MEVNLKKRRIVPICEKVLRDTKLDTLFFQTRSILIHRTVSRRFDLQKYPHEDLIMKEVRWGKKRTIAASLPSSETRVRKFFYGRLILAHTVKNWDSSHFFVDSL